MQNIKIELIEEEKDIKTFTDEYFKNYTYNIKIPLKNVKKINFIFVYKNDIKETLNVGFGDNLLLDKLESAYYIKDRYIITYYKKNIIVKKGNIKQKIKYKINYLKELNLLKKADIIKYKEIIKIDHNKKRSNNSE